MSDQAVRAIFYLWVLAVGLSGVFVFRLILSRVTS